jgi:hypothetical protein
MLEAIERLVKAGIRYGVAVNQGPAKLLLDPLYEAVAARLVESVPLDPRLAATRYEDNLFFKYARNARRVQWSVHELDFRRARPERLTARQRALVHTFATGETSGFTVGASFLEAFRNSPELGSFFSVWLHEENNHYWAFHAYLERIGEAWPRARKEEVTSVEFLPYSRDPLEVAAANMHQELMGYLVYRSFARHCGDPFFAALVDTIAKDELRHYKFYQAVVGREIQRNPRFRAIVLKHFFKASTPLNQVSGSPRRVVANLLGPAFYFRGPEFRYLGGQLQFLLGDPFEPWFAWFYRRNFPPCGRCGEETFRCFCARIEEDAPAQGPEVGAVSEASALE